ncbi:acyl-CoA dehydrogenase family protein [Citricoccus sp. I39-566]|uniref:acyl-CoA dehydrogenase family protein n=1 Tax=Citricoccus sp. I39-566 TaxID=3073268 RepID=UPI00286D0331|nr:acyl-CoA dehydrogenase family protein [Citricoccus sp. I39-566]WMY78899.1 acyl-CoA dehydrogenase family protein [Citricoccus sp. I39-566]
MSWYGTALEDEQAAVRAMLDDLASSLAEGSEHQGHTEQARSAIVESGMWVLGAPEDLGGAGADLATTLLVLERLGRYWPALGWASAQAQAALTILAHGSQSDLSAGVADGSSAVAVLEAESAHVSVTGSHDGRWTGQIDRIDVAADTAAVIILDGESAAWLFTEDALSFDPVGVTGLEGARTRSVTLDAARAELVTTELLPARALLRLSAGAIAAGIAGAAADAAREYAASRSQFGGALTLIPVVRQSLVEQVNGATQAITTVMSADSASLASVTAAMENALQAGVTVAGQSVQSLGGYGYLDEYPTGRFVRDAASLRSAVDSFSANRQSARSLAGLPWTTLQGESS